MAEPGSDIVLTRTNLAGFGDEPSNWQASAVFGAGGLGALQPGTIDPSAPADLCSFDAFINSEGVMEVRWVAKPLSNVVSFRLVRSPLDDLGAKVVVATYPAASWPKEIKYWNMCNLWMRKPIPTSSTCTGCRR